LSVAAGGDAASDVHEGGDGDGDRRRHRQGAAVRRRQAHAAPAGEQRGGRAARAAAGRGFHPRRLRRQADLPTRGRTARSNFFNNLKSIRKNEYFVAAERKRRRPGLPNADAGRSASPHRQDDQSRVSKSSNKKI
jgi:hypothetical protein